MTELEELIGYRFKNAELLRTALTHSSFGKENKTEYNERLEFLGDSILGMTVAEYLYRNHPEMPEGKMTRLRSQLVCEHCLAAVAKRLSIDKCLRLGNGEILTGGAKKSMMADAVEAVLAAVYLDGGDPSTIIYKYILEPFRESGEVDDGDYKTELQELIQRESGHTVEYRIVDSKGPDHNKTFYVSVFIDGETLGTGVGKTKKEAAQSAAGQALEKLKK